MVFYKSCATLSVLPQNKSDDEVTLVEAAGITNFSSYSYLFNNIGTACALGLTLLIPVVASAYLADCINADFQIIGHIRCLSLITRLVRRKCTCCMTCSQIGQ